METKVSMQTHRGLPVRGALVFSNFGHIQNIDELQEKKSGYGFSALESLGCVLLRPYISAVLPLWVAF